MKTSNQKRFLDSFPSFIKKPTRKLHSFAKDFYGFREYSFSQEGEDRLLKRIFEKKKQGFYVDVGAHHPKRFSNTYLFYLEGWTGINIDATPGSMKAFNKFRPKDINLEIAVSNTLELMSFYMFDEPALNSFSEEISLNHVKSGNFKVIEKKNISTQKLSDILDRFLEPGQQIDFLSIDVEGLDFEVLESNNWEIYKPKIILIEDLSSYLYIANMSSRTKSFLGYQGYQPFAKTINTIFYRLEDFPVKS